MQAYEAGTAAYFATPPVNLIYAFHASLSQITRQAPSLEERFRLHRAASQRMKAAAAELGMKQLAVDDAVAANGMTALWFPEGVSAADILGPLAKKDVVVAGGLHKDHKRECLVVLAGAVGESGLTRRLIAVKYFRIGYVFFPSPGPALHLLSLAGPGWLRVDR